MSEKLRNVVGQEVEFESSTMSELVPWVESQTAFVTNLKRELAPYEEASHLISGLEEAQANLNQAVDQYYAIANTNNDEAQATYLPQIREAAQAFSNKKREVSQDPLIQKIAESKGRKISEALF